MASNLLAMASILVAVASNRLGHLGTVSHIGPHTCNVCISHRLNLLCAPASNRHDGRLQQSKALVTSSDALVPSSFLICFQCKDISS